MLTSELFLMCAAPPLVVIGGLSALRWIRRDHHKRQPLVHPQQRYPGFSTCRRIDALEGRLFGDLAGLMVCFVVPGAVLAATGHENSDAAVHRVVALVVLLILSFLIWRILRTLYCLQNCRRGLLGEQAVGQQLNQLMHEGYHVFHDFSFGTENVDHVLVGPGGIFSIETKYKRKDRRADDGQKVFFNGKRLRFGAYETSAPLDQARHQSKRLLKIVKHVANGRTVQPVVVYPGWFVEQEKGEVDVIVLNDQRLITWLAKQRTVLDDKTIYRVADLLAERCRQPDPESPEDFALDASTADWRKAFQTVTKRFQGIGHHRTAPPSTAAHPSTSQEAG